MPTIGPSKEELKNYFQNNRQYFDELAKYYRELDPKYYEEYITPFYRNPFNASGSGGNKKGCMTLTVSIALLIAGLTAGIVFFVMQESERKTNYESPRIQPTEKRNSSADSLKPVPIDSVKKRDRDEIKKKRDEMERGLRQKPIERTR